MIRRDLRDAEDGIWRQLLDMLLCHHRAIVALKSVGIIGGTLVAAVGGGMEGGLRDDLLFTEKGWLIICGAGAAVISGLILLLADGERPDMIGQIRQHLSTVRRFSDDHAEMVARERWRINCDSASKIMIEVVEQLLLQPSGMIEDDIQTWLDFSVPELRQALSMVDGEDYTFSVYKRSDSLGYMARIADHWLDEVDAEIDRRPWAKGQGFTGQAWLKNETIAVPDANEPGMRQIYAQKPEDYPQALRDDHVRPDEERYRSFLCVPIKVGTAVEPWGILTVTSDTVGRFDRIDAQTPGSDNVQIIRFSAALIALLVASQGIN